MENLHEHVKDVALIKPRLKNVNFDLVTRTSKMLLKRVISCLLAVALLLTLALPAAMAAYERASCAFTYRIKGNGTAAITGYDWGNRWIHFTIFDFTTVGLIKSEIP